MWLLNFLLGVYQAVQDWFSGNYWYWSSIVKSVPKWLDTVRANLIAYYNAAINAIYPAVSGFYNKYIDPVLDDIRTWLTGVETKANQALTAANNFLIDVSAKLTALKYAITDWVVAKYDDWISGIKATVDKVLRVDIPNLFGYINTLLPFQSWLALAAGALNIEDIKKKLNYIGSIWNMLVMFFDNPIGFILGLFWQFALTFLSYVIGYALGSTKYPLPAIPNWSNLTRR